VPLWLYNVTPLYSALIMVAVIETASLIGLFLTRRFLVPKFIFSEGINDAISGSVQVIGVFYGITVGLIAIGVWDTKTTASDMVSREAAAIGGLYRDLGGYPSPIKEELRAQLKDYTVFTIEQAWPAQSKGQILDGGTKILDGFQAQLFTFQPGNASQVAIHQEALRAYNGLIEYRRLRVDAVGSGLSPVMWSVIWVGAIISIFMAYLFKVEDPRLHVLLIGLMAGFLSMVLFMIVINDKPFYGAITIPPDAYKLILERVIMSSN
jgi:hypothetical protein